MGKKKDIELYMAEMERDLLKKLDEIERRDASHKEDSLICTEPFGNATQGKAS